MYVDMADCLAGGFATIHPDVEARDRGAASWTCLVALSRSKLIALRSGS